MKHLIKKQSFLFERKLSKTHEQHATDPQIGDYVICEENLMTNATNRKRICISNNIGNIIDYNPTINSDYKYMVYYENAPEDLFWFNGKDKVRQMSRKEIIYYSKNKEDLEIYLDANKYNL